MILKYQTREVVSLSLESFHNAGLTREETREAIESVRTDNGMKLYAEPTGLNGNWEFGVWNDWELEELVYLVERNLNEKLKAKNR